MKRLFAILIAFFLCSCSMEDTPDEVLPYQRLPMTAEADFSCEAGDGRVRITLESADNYTVEYLSPEIMRGVSSESAGGRSYICFPGSRIETGESDTVRGSLASAGLFMLDPSSCSEPVYKDGMYDVSAVSDGITALVTVKDGMPQRIEGTVAGFRCTFTNIVITYG